VVEALNPAGTFVPNDARLDADREQLVLVTGPNMAGKSTFMRQVAHIVILAQLGSFVPASAARSACAIGCSPGSARPTTWRAATRPSWSRCARPRRSCAHATRRSLVILDEVGRGTSTFDGVSIAWAVAEYLHDAIGARTLFATHYHELVALADDRPRVANVSARCASRPARSCSCGGSSPAPPRSSYGIDVARLAGLPRSVIARAREILARLEGDGGALPTGRRLAARPPGQLSLLAAVTPPPDPRREQAVERLRALDPDRMTPLEALTALAELRDLVR
jgi:DNA mismatch repair protein MutS